MHATATLELTPQPRPALAPHKTKHSKIASGFLFALLVVVHLIPIWTTKYFPTQDGPSHLHNADLILHYADPAMTAFRQYCVLDLRPLPNFMGHAALASLLALVPPLLAEKILLSGYVVLLPLSIFYALRSLKKSAGWLAVLSFPFIYSLPLYFGMYNFCYSLIAFFLVIGYWAKHRTRLGFKHGGTLAILAMLVYSCHLFSFLMAIMCVAFLGLARSIGQWQRVRHISIAKILARNSRSYGLATLLSFLPAMAGGCVHVAHGRRAGGKLFRKNLQSRRDPQIHRRRLARCLQPF